MNSFINHNTRYTNITKYINLKKIATSELSKN